MWVLGVKAAKFMLARGELCQFRHNIQAQAFTYMRATEVEDGW